jgi:hypothetical protein
MILAGDLSVIEAPKASKFGKGSYGVNHYSRVATLDLVGDLPLIGSVSADLDIAGQVFFNGALSAIVNFGGTGITMVADLAGDLPIQIDLGGTVGLDQVVDGDLPFTVVLACSGMLSGPLWASSEPCPPPPWAPTEPCPPSMWTPVPPPTFVPPSGGWTKQEEVDDLPVWSDAT